MVDGIDGRESAAPVYPMARLNRCPFDPPPELYRMQAEGPASRVRLWDGSIVWLITRYEEQRALASDERISSDSARPGYPHVSEGIKARRLSAPTLLTMDNPDHDALRRMITADFTVKRVESLRPAIQSIVDGLIDSIIVDGSDFDLVSRFALPVPSNVICVFLGAPLEDQGFFQERTRSLIDRASTPAETARASIDLRGYARELLDTKRRMPTGDLTSRLSALVQQERLSEIDAVEIVLSLIVGGHETTANMIALGTLALLQHPEQLAQFRAGTEPQEIAGAAEELLRYLNIPHIGRRRVALADIRLDESVIQAGSGVIFANDIANRDPRAFEHPDDLDISRHAEHHLAFGFGIHQCIGQPLARVELQVAYETLFRRLPGLRLVSSIDEVEFKTDMINYGVWSLSLSWDRGLT
jgi:cytochrome P450